MAPRLSVRLSWVVALLIPLAFSARAQNLPGDDELSWGGADAPPPPDDAARPGRWGDDGRDRYEGDDEDHRRWGRDRERDDDDDDQGERGDGRDYRRGYRDGRRDASLADFRSDSDLSWAGEWIDTPEYGVVWRPTRVASDWRPYTYGRWAWTSSGWLWVSDEPFGWAVYHYGRWSFSPAVGWLWLPGRAWAPAWVSWRWGEGFAAWCPLGPGAFVAVEPAVWVVVPQRVFVEPVQHHAVPISQIASVLPGARAIPRAGPRVAQVAQVTGRAVRPVQVVEVGSPRASGASGGAVQVYRAHATSSASFRDRPQRSGTQQSGSWSSPRPAGSGAGRGAEQPRSAPAAAPVRSAPARAPEREREPSWRGERPHSQRDHLRPSAPSAPREEPRSEPAAGRPRLEMSPVRAERSFAAETHFRAPPVAARTVAPAAQAGFAPAPRATVAPAAQATIRREARSEEPRSERSHAAR